MWLYVVAVVLLAAAPSRADNRYENARNRFGQAMRAFDAHRYTEAAQLFRESYALAPLPELLIDLGRCEEELHLPQAALDDYERYLAVAGGRDGVVERDVAGRVRALRKLLATRAPSAATTAPATGSTMIDAPTAGAGGAAAAGSASLPGAPLPGVGPTAKAPVPLMAPTGNGVTSIAAAAPAPGAERQRARRRLWIGLGAGGGALVITAVVLGVTLGVAHAPPSTNGGNYVPTLH